MRITAAPGHRFRIRGFTLLEILVVMSLLSVVMLALGSALRTIGQTEERIDQRLQRADEMRIAVGFIRSTLARVSARKVALPPPAKPNVLFAARTDSVAWIGIMPARYGAGGRYFFRLALEVTDAVPALVIRFMPWGDAPDFPDWSRAESRVLVRQVTSVAMYFQDGQASPPHWSMDWTTNDRLPSQLRMELQTVSGPWPTVIFPMRAMPASNFSGAAFGAS